MQKIKIAIDVNEANVSNRVGSNQYAFEILWAFYSLDHKNQYTLYSSKPISSDLPPKRKNWRYRVIGPAKLWTQWRLPLELYKNKGNFDVFFTPGHYAPRFSPVPTVVTIMDLAFIYFPKLFKKKDTVKLTGWTKYSVKNAAHIIAISNNTKRDIAKNYNIRSNQITIAYPGFTQIPSAKKLPDVFKKYQLPKKYVLYLGTIQPRKNLVRLIKAFENITEDIDLVLAGKKGWLYQEVLSAYQQSPKKDQIHFLDYVDNDDLAQLYKHAACLVLPGIYEGFGLPPLEALVHGTLSVVASTGSLPEVVGEKGILVDPYNINSISNGIENAIKLTTKEKNQLLKKAKQHVKKFSWEKSAKIILGVLHDVTTT